MADAAQAGPPAKKRRGDGGQANEQGDGNVSFADSGGAQAEFAGGAGVPELAVVGGDDEREGDARVGVEGPGGSGVKVKVLTEKDVASGEFKIEHVVGGWMDGLAGIVLVWG